ncbi:MAG: secondary thiamine-phosphate synthase enzyme YjbQ [Candidatus Eremiobacterota bacterium]
MFETFPVSTPSRVCMINIDSEVEKVIKKTGIKNGICVVYVPHTTAGVTINEGADPAVISDITDTMNKLIPVREQYLHMEGNSDAHIKTSLVGSSEHIIIEDGKPVMGTWQRIFFCEFDGPRHRKVYVKVIGE